MRRCGTTCALVDGAGRVLTSSTACCERQLCMVPGLAGCDKGYNATFMTAATSRAQQPTVLRVVQDMRYVDAKLNSLLSLTDRAMMGIDDKVAEISRNVTALEEPGADVVRYVASDSSARTAQGHLSPTSTAWAALAIGACRVQATVLAEAGRPLAMVTRAARAGTRDDGAAAEGAHTLAAVPAAHADAAQGRAARAPRQARRLSQLWRGHHRGRVRRARSFTACSSALSVALAARANA